MINMAGLHRIAGIRSNDIETSYEDFVRSSHNNPDKLVQKKTFLKLRKCQSDIICRRSLLVS